MRLCAWFAGIDLESRYLTASLGVSSGGEAPRILGSKVFGVQSGDIQPLDNQSFLQECMSDIGEWFHLETGGTLTDVAVAVPGGTISEFPSSGVFEFGAPSLISDAVIETARQRALAGPGKLGTVVSSTIRGYEVDGRPLVESPVGDYATSLRVATTSWVARTAAIQTAIDAVRQIGLDINMVVPRAVAGAESTVTPIERRDGATVVMIGNETTECATFIDSSLCDLFTVPLGQRPLRHELSRACNVSADVFDRLDLGLMMERVPSDPMVQRVRTVMSAWATALFSAIRRRMQERDLGWRQQPGIVIANSPTAFPMLEDRATRVIGSPARFAPTSRLFDRVAGVSHGSFAALGLIPMQWSARRMEGQRPFVHHPESLSASTIRFAESAGREGLGHAIGRWLREFVPADHHQQY